MNSRWNAVRDRLLQLGWRADDGDVLHSPRDSLLVDRDMFEGSNRDGVLESLRQHISTIKRYKAEGFSPEGVDEALAEFEEVLHLLEGYETT